MNISTFGTYTMARLGIYVAQQALSVTGNNISNINTEGYSREDINLYNIAATGADRYLSKMDVRVSGGAVVNSLVQVRDAYLDIRYRNENSAVGYMDARLAGLEDLSSVFDEVGRGDDENGVIEAQLEDMIQQMETLLTQGAGKDGFDTMFRNSASVFTELMRSRSNQLDTLMYNKTVEFEQDLQETNSLLTRIRDLSAEIRRTQVYGGQPLTQIDERNKLIDELSNFVQIDVQYEQEHLGENVYVDKLVITTGGTPTRTLLDGVYATQLSITQVQDTDEDGNPLYDGNGNPVMVNDPNFDLELSALTDRYGRTNPKATDMGATTVAVKGTYGASEKTSASQYDTKEIAQAIADQLNNDENYYKDSGGTYYYYHVSDSAEDGFYYIHKHPVVGDGDTVEKRMTNRNTSEYTYSLISLDQAASESGGKKAEYSSKEIAQTIADMLPASGIDSAGNVCEYTYTPVETAENSGKWVINKTSITTGAADLTDTELYGALQGEREILTEKGVYATAADLAEDTDAATKRGIPYYQKALDTLANTFAKLLNNANQLEDINKGTDKALYKYDSNGNIEIDDKGYYVLSDYAKTELGYEDGDGGGVLFSNDGNKNTCDNITAGNIAISQSWANGSFRVLSSTKADAGSTASDNLARILNIFTQKYEYTPQTDGLNTGADEPSSKLVYFTGSFQELLTTHIAGSLANDKGVTEIILDNYSVTLDELYVERDAVMGVDLNDEAVNMMIYQKSYAAACRLMTMYDEMLDKLINGTA